MCSTIIWLFYAIGGGGRGRGKEEAKSGKGANEGEGEREVTRISCTDIYI